MLSFSFQKPIICLHKLSCCPFLNSPTQTITQIIRTNNDKASSVVFMSQPKRFVLSIGSTGLDSKDLVPSGEFSVCEDQIDDTSNDDEFSKGGGNSDTYFVSNEEFPLWGKVEDDNDEDDKDNIERREEVDASFVFNKELPTPEEVDDDDDFQGKDEFDTSFVPEKDLTPWGEVEDDDDNDYVERREEVDASFVPNKGLPPWGEEDDNGDHGDDHVKGREESYASFVFKKGLPPWGQVEDDGDNDGDDVEGRGEVDASFVSKKGLPPWGEMEDDEHRDSRPAVTTLSASKEMRHMPDHGAIFLEEMDENVLSNRILVLSRTNKVRSAMEYFMSMELLDLCPNIHACNSLMSSLMRNGWFDECLKVFNFTRTRQITTGHTYSLILMAHVKAWGCDSALKFFRELESECDMDKDFDAAVYNTMISICRKVENWDEIGRVWRRMKENGYAGTHVTYRLLVNSFAHCGQSQLALYAYHEMIQNGFEPDSNTLNAIISVCAKDGKQDAALSVFQKMLTGRLKPNLIACNALISSLGRAGELKIAFQVYDKMKSLGHKPDAYTFNALLSSLNKANRHEEALQLFEMIERDQSSQFNIYLYNTVLMSCSKLRLWDKALEIFWQMEASGLSDLTIAYNLVIRTCELARKPTIALQVYEHMVHQKCSPNMFTYLSIIRCCVRGDLWEELEEILNKTMPNAILYNAAIQGMCLHGKANLANKVYTKMLESGLQPDVKTRVLMHSMIRK